jgi:hypothetical protein
MSCASCGELGAEISQFVQMRSPVDALIREIAIHRL